MQRFLAAYANEESARAGLGITVSAVLPGMTPETDIGRAAIAAYADRAGVSEQQLSQHIPPPVTPLTAGDAFVALASGERNRARTPSQAPGSKSSPPNVSSRTHWAGGQHDIGRIAGHDPGRHGSTHGDRGPAYPNDRAGLNASIG
jgi:hypothetical protein